MRLHSEREPTPSPISSSCARFRLLASVLVLALLCPVTPAIAFVSFSEMARLSAADRTTLGEVLSVYQGYVFLGLRGEAASYLERKVHLGQVTPETAAPIFEEAVREQSRWDETFRLMSICETAMRSGVRTPPILYSYGAALLQAGRYADAKAVLSRIPDDSPYFPYALYAFGQVAAAEGDDKAALEFFARAEKAAENPAAGEYLKRRAERSRAQLLIAMGRQDDAEPLLDFREQPEADPTASIAWEAARRGRESGTAGPTGEQTAAMPPRERILLSMLRGGLSREAGRFDEAIAHMEHAEEYLQAIIGSTIPRATETLQTYEVTELLDRQIENHRRIRNLLSSNASQEPPESVRPQIVELLVGLLFMDHLIAREQGLAPVLAQVPEVPYLSSEDIEEVFRRIEEVSLDGVEVDRLVEDLSGKVDVLRNLAHPIWRFRLLTKLENSQGEIRAAKERIRKSRDAAIAGVEAGKEASLSGLLKDVGTFLKELGDIRAASEELKDFTKRHFDILRRKIEEEPLSRAKVREMAREAIRYDDELFASMLPSVNALEEKARIIAWERQKQELIAMRSAVARQKVDALLAKAHFLQGRQDANEARTVWALLEEAATHLAGSRLSPRDRIDTAIHIGSLLQEGAGRWERFPGRPFGEKERELTAKLFPLLSEGAKSGEREEEASYVLASLKIRSKDPSGAEAGRAFLRDHPSSPFAGWIALRLGHEALLAGKVQDAVSLYRNAADGPDPEATGVARYMLAWDRFQRGDSGGAAREISGPLSDPMFRCEDPSPFEQEVLALAVRTWRETPLERLGEFPPVREQRCTGRLLLAALGEEEKSRGEAGRAAVVYDLLARRFVEDEAALSYEAKSLEELVRAGQEDRAFARALRLGETYGPGSDWAGSQPPEVRKRAADDLAGMLRTLSEKKFEEGIRTGHRTIMASAKEGMTRYFAMREGRDAAEDQELLLKWGIASLRSGDRQRGLEILEEVMARNGDEVGERAGILYAETMVAGYERKEESAKDAEDAVLRLLEKFPSEKAASLAYRAAAAFLGTGEFARAGDTASKVVNAKDAPLSLEVDARLIHAEALLSLGYPAEAKGMADAVLARRRNGDDPELVERARDLFVLASLKMVEARTAEEDWAGAARQLEELGERFPEAEGAPSYFLRALRSYRLAEDGDGAIRAGTRFLELFPRRDEAVEVAGIVGTFLADRDEFVRAAQLYETVSKRFPKSGQSQDFLFLAARLSVEHGDPEGAKKRFADYRERYSDPRWMNAYATLSLGFLSLRGGEYRRGIRELEKGLRQVEADLEKDSPRQVYELAGKARIAVGDHWAEQFRKIALTAPLERSLAIKERFFRQALESFEKARTDSPVEEAIEASLRSGDLFVEFGESVRASERPKGMKTEEKDLYENALTERAETFFERAQEIYVAALDRLEAEKGPSDLADPIRKRIQDTQTLLSGPGAGPVAK